MDTQPDDQEELTHRLWWKLGDVLRTDARYAWSLLLDVAFTNGNGWCDRVLRCIEQSWDVVEERARLESLYSEMTWELMGTC